MQGYQWLKERVNSEEGRKQLAKIKELRLMADRLGCTSAQLAIGMDDVCVSVSVHASLFFFVHLCYLMSLSDTLTYCFELKRRLK